MKSLDTFECSLLQLQLQSQLQHQLNIQLRNSLFNFFNIDPVQFSGEFEFPEQLWN